MKIKIGIIDDIADNIIDIKEALSKLTHNKYEFYPPRGSEDYIAKISRSASNRETVINNIFSEIQNMVQNPDIAIDFLIIDLDMYKEDTEDKNTGLEIIRKISQCIEFPNIRFLPMLIFTRFETNKLPSDKFFAHAFLTKQDETYLETFKYNNINLLIEHFTDYTKDHLAVLNGKYNETNRNLQKLHTVLERIDHKSDQLQFSIDTMIKVLPQLSLKGKESQIQTFLENEFEGIKEFEFLKIKKQNFIAKYKEKAKSQAEEDIFKLVKETIQDLAEDEFGKEEDNTTLAAIKLALRGYSKLLNGDF